LGEKINVNMKILPRTISILLLEGDPTSVQTVKIGGWDGKAIVIPRSKIKHAAAREECGTPSLYFLIGHEQEDSILPTVYIGEAENLCERLASHESEKEFWNLAIGFVGGSLDKGGARYLESLAIKKALRQRLCNLVNKTEPPTPKLSEEEIAVMDGFFENVALLMSLLGHSFLKDIPTQKIHTEQDPLFYCTGKGAEAVGRPANDGFIVYRSSTASKNPSKAVKKSNERVFEELKRIGVIADHSQDLYVFAQDYVFKSPSGASDIVIGNSSNGWDLWKTKDGRTLDEVVRKAE
jgi:hypothetical protein